MIRKFYDLAGWGGGGLGVGTDPVPQQKEGLRYNNGKTRYDLLEPYALEQLAKVFTIGAKKYQEHNWELGMAWTKVLASLKRHIAEFEKGEDYDEETKLHHMAHAAWNAMALVSYYKIAPQYDDRYHKYLHRPKIGLDIDEVICGWSLAWCEKFGYPIPEHWNFSYNNKEHFESFNGDIEEFYLNIPPLIKAIDMPFEPHCYITSRSVPKELTMKWLQNHGFPTVPVYSVGLGMSKVDVAKEAGIEIFVDDRFENFVELNNAGICTYLWDAPHNRKYQVGHKRIKSLKELV